MRSTTLFGAAVAIGVIGGVGTGYAIQAARPATPLPPLSQTQPQYAPAGVYQGLAPAMLPAAQDDAALTDGDLTKLLLPMPSGATANPSGWLDQTIDAEQEADLCTVGAVSCFTAHYNEGVVSIADTSWVQNGFDVEIRIYRFAAGKSAQARNWAENASTGTAVPVPSGINGTAYEYVDKWGADDDTAIAVHGDLVIDFWVTSRTTVPNPSIIDNLITQQMGRL
jgi:hypothetical protein